MFDRFTQEAKNAVILAQEEARLHGHTYLGTEHLLLGILHQNNSMAVTALECLGLTLEPVRQQALEILGVGSTSPNVLPFTPRARKVLELAYRESEQLGSNYIGPEHLLLGILREGEGIACQTIVALGSFLILSISSVLR